MVAVKRIKEKVKTLPILYLCDEDLFKIFEIDASELGWGGVLKQQKYGQDYTVCIKDME